MSWGSDSSYCPNTFAPGCKSHKKVKFNPKKRKVRRYRGKTTTVWRSGVAGLDGRRS